MIWKGRKKTNCLILLLAVSSVLLCGYTPEDSRVYDEAGLFSEDEISMLEEEIDTVANEIEMDVAILTVYSGEVDEDNGGVDYARAFIRQEGLGYDEADGATLLMLVDMQTRGMYFVENQREGVAFLYTDSEINQIYETVREYFSAGDYYEGAYAFLESAVMYSGINENSGEEEYDGDLSNDDVQDWNTESDIGGISGERLLINLLISMGISAAIVVLLVIFNKTGSKVSGNVFVKDGGFKIRNQSDLFTHTTTTKRRIETNSGGRGGGGFSGGSGGGGGSHSHGGGGKF